MLNILYLGQKPVGEEAFEQLLAAQGQAFKVCAACTNTTHEVWWKSCKVYERCQELGIACLGNDKRHEEELLSLIDEHGINCVISVQHNWVLSEKVLAAVGHNAYNLHLAKLPEYKGYYAFNHAILNGDATFAVTLHHMTKDVDEGFIAFSEEFPIVPEDTAYALYEKAVKAGLIAFGKLVGRFAKDAPVPKHAMEGKDCFYGKNSLDGLRKINDVTNPEEVDCRVRAFYFPPYEGAWYELGGKKYYLIQEK